MSDSRDEIQRQLDDALHAGMGPKIVRFALSCLGGVPVVGGVFGAGSDAWSEAEHEQFKKILAAWLKLQEEEIREIGRTLLEIMQRLDTSDETIRERLSSPEYLSLIKKSFRDWSAAESEEKRRLVRNLLANAAATRLCGDDIIRMFVEWIDRYTEMHFRVVRTVHDNQGATRLALWQEIHGDDVRENSGEADLFKLLIHDLSVGHVIRQQRETDSAGRFLKAQPKRGRRSATPFMKSAFDDEKGYELTELGRWFVHYTMNEIVPKIAATASGTRQEGAG